jgi:hypothetical protein
MNILLNDALTLSADANGGHFIITEVGGLGPADIRTSSFLFSGRSGGLVTDQFYGFRNITITGEIGANDMTLLQHKEDRQALLNALPIGATIPVYITDFYGDTYRIDASVTSAKVEYKRRGYRSDFLIQLTAGDPLFYSTEGGDEQSAIVNRTLDNGGYVTPYILPVVWDQGGAPTIVSNTGNAVVYPTITIHDETHDPILTNQATGEQFAMSINTNDGDELVIDMLNRTVKLNGSDVIGNKVDGSVWFGLLVGDNAIRFDTDTPEDSGYAEVVWRNGVTGI